MERADILNKIIDTENKAKDLRESALRIQNELSENIASATKKIREQSYHTAQQEITAFEEQEKQRADAELKRLDAEQSAKVSQLRSLYDDKHNEWSNKLMNIVIGS